jgi:hypothetical protein
MVEQITELGPMYFHHMWTYNGSCRFSMDTWETRHFQREAWSRATIHKRVLIVE